MTIAVDILTRSTRWRTQRRVRPTVIDAINAAARVARRRNGEICVVLTHDRAIRALNRDWRGKDKPTNVLSFPAAQPTPGAMLGDIVIAYETLAREAKADGKPFLHHLAHLTVHGFLHLLGYDHEENRQAEAMEQMERRILAHLDIGDPYANTDLTA